MTVRPGIFRTRREALVFVLWLVGAYVVPIVAVWAVT